MNPSRLARPSALLTPLIAIGVTVVLMPWAQSVRAGLQLEEEGLAIYGTVRYVGTLDVVQGAKGVLTPLPRSFSVSSLPEVTTDRTGRFVFDGLSPGRYSISLRYPNDSESFLRPKRQRAGTTGVRASFRHQSLDAPAFQDLGSCSRRG